MPRRDFHTWLTRTMHPVSTIQAAVCEASREIALQGLDVTIPALTMVRVFSHGACTMECCDPVGPWLTADRPGAGVVANARVVNMADSHGRRTTGNPG